MLVFDCFPKTARPVVLYYSYFLHYVQLCLLSKTSGGGAKEGMNDEIKKCSSRY